MTDRELIELAAKAAGIQISWLGLQDFDNPRRIVEGFVCGQWNPIKDDADAFRLAVKLRLELSYSYEPGVFFAGEPEGFFKDRDAKVAYAEVGDDSGDQYALMRLAITRAAPKIGKAM